MTIKLQRYYITLVSDNKIFFSDNKFKNNSFKSLFINNNVKFYLGDIHFLVKGSCKAGVTLAQYTSFFGQNCKLNTTKDILANKDVVFICMLILKVAMISFTIGRKVCISKKKPLIVYLIA